jgi:CRISPR-associated protein Csd1
MILKALYDFYERKLAIDKIEPIGFAKKEIDYFVIIDQDGNYVDFEKLQIPKGKKFSGTPFTVPSIGKQVQKHDNSGEDANLLWDKSEFVLGVGNNGRKKLSSFIKTISQFYPDPPEDIKALQNFYDKELLKIKPFETITDNSEIGEIIKTGSPILSFKIKGNATPICSQQHVKQAVENKAETDLKYGTCLITGQVNVPIEKNHIVVKRIIGSQTSGANLVSFNKPSSLSYHKDQSYNAPTSKYAAEAYTKSLQQLVDSEHNKKRVADTTILFWSEKKSEEIAPEEEAFAWLIAAQKIDDDNPDRGVDKIEKFIDSIFTGNYQQAKTNHFFVLGLSPNAARISVRFWKTPSVENFGLNIKKHFEDFKIIHGPQEQKYLSLYEILSSVSIVTNKRDKPNVIFFRGKAYDVIPNLSGQLVEAIIDGSQYPLNLVQQCIIRMRAEASKKDKNGKTIPNVNYARAAILKAYLNRFNRIHKQNQKEITMSLDKTNTNVGYLLGRLFSVIERAQFVSNNYKEPNAGIRDRFFGSFSSSPISVLPIIEKLYGHHLKKIKNSQKFFETKILDENKKEIIDKLKPSEIPAHLTLQQQALFTIGYYHQKQELESFKSNKKENSSTNN